MNIDKYVIREKIIELELRSTKYKISIDCLLHFKWAITTEMLFCCDFSSFYSQMFSMNRIAIAQLFRNN